ncbi:hypothetical protein D3C81_1904230 [compost metagenome]
MPLRQTDLDIDLRSVLARRDRFGAHAPGFFAPGRRLGLRGGVDGLAVQPQQFTAPPKRFCSGIAEQALRSGGPGYVAVVLVSHEKGVRRGL